MTVAEFMKRMEDRRLSVVLTTTPGREYLHPTNHRVSLSDVTVFVEGRRGAMLMSWHLTARNVSDQEYPDVVQEWANKILLESKGVVFDEIH